MPVLIILFKDFLKISLFTIGGGLAMLPLIENNFVNKRKLLSKDDIIEMITLTQTIPGLIAINSAIFTGYKVAGFKGCIVSVLAVLIPSIVILTAIALFFPLLDLQNEYLLKIFNCVRAGVLGMFITLAWRLGKNILKTKLDFFIICALMALLCLKISSVTIILLAFTAGYLVTLYQNREEK